MADAHVVPRGDLIEHQADDDCACGPTSKPVEGGFVTVHHSLDGREQHEIRRCWCLNPLDADGICNYGGEAHTLR